VHSALLLAQGSIYAALAKVAPYDAREEEERRNAQYGYYGSGEPQRCCGNQERLSAGPS
jgi:hypothetical protein